MTIYRQGEYVDLCRGPHVPSTGRIQIFHLLNVAGAYWRGNSDNAMMQRVYGTAWFDKKDLKKYLQMREEAKERDHRKLGKELDLFMISQEVGQGLPFWLPNGATVVASWSATSLIKSWLQATNTSTLRLWPLWSFIRLLVTGSTTRRICSQPWIWVMGKSLFFVL